MWHRIERITHTTSGEISAECQIPRESQWFSGHFPGKPILPGIAQLAMVRETISRGINKAGDRSRWVSCQFSRIKFKKMIMPGERLRILASPKKNVDTYAFRITVENTIVCSGNLKLKNDR